MKIGILQTGLAPDDLKADFGEYPEMFATLLADRGFEFEAFSVVQGQFPDGPEAADGWLITGSRHGVYEDHDWLPPLEQIIRDIVSAERPIVGVCFGHQVIAKALGGVVEKYDGGWAIGPQTYDFDQGTRVIQAWHQDQVITPPDGAQTVARNDFCAHAALLYPGKAYSVQAHPEFGDGFVTGLIDKRGRGVVPDAILDAATADIGTPLHQTELADQFALFFREGRIS